MEGSSGSFEVDDFDSEDETESEKWFQADRPAATGRKK